MCARLRLLAGLALLLAACGAPALISPSETAAPTSLPAAGTPAPPVTPAPTFTQPAPTNTPAIPTTQAPTLPPPTPTDTPMPAAASSLPDPAGYAWNLALSGSSYPVFVTGAGDGSGAVYVVQQSGQIRIARQGQLLDTSFLDISDRTSPAARPGYYGERGLLGLAFHPQYKDNGYFYVNYTDQNGNTVIARYQRSAGSPDQADPGSEMRLLEVKQPFANHNGGMLAFGPDGYLYAGLGDGGSAGDPYNNAQSTQTYLGKILRLDVNQGSPYGIPPDNPFANGGGLAEIWAYGLRNPWRFSFDPLTGDLYIGDVGQNVWEEIDYLPAGSPGGANFGWRYREGTHGYLGAAPAGLELKEPVIDYHHAPGCSVTGGVVVRSPSLPDWQGVYLYGDYCSGQIWGLLKTSSGDWLHQELFDTGMNITTFGVDEAGEVYLADYASGNIYRLSPLSK